MITGKNQKINHLERDIQNVNELVINDKHLFEDRRLEDQNNDIQLKIFTELEKIIDNISKDLNQMMENLHKSKKEYQRGMIVPNIHKQIIPIIVDINLSDSPNELQ